MRDFDEINNLSEDELIDIDTYFDGMELTEEEKKERKEFAYDFLEIILFIFALFSVMREYQYLKIDYITGKLQARYFELVRKYGIIIDENIKQYIEDVSAEIIDATKRHIDEEYFLSQDRATIISENESLSIMGYSELSSAIKNGYTRKQWITERDNKVRKTHREVDGLILPISEPFVVGDSLLQYAHDALSFSADPKEICGCRCVTKYLK